MASVLVRLTKGLGVEAREEPGAELSRDAWRHARGRQGGLQAAKGRELPAAVRAVGEVTIELSTTARGELSVGAGREELGQPRTGEAIRGGLEVLC